MYLVAAGNTVVPTILLIRQLGYSLTIDKQKGLFRAGNGGNSFEAEDPLMVLGLIKLIEMKGDNWKASDKEIEDILKEIS